LCAVHRGRKNTRHAIEALSGAEVLLRTASAARRAELIAYKVLFVPVVIKQLTNQQREML